MSPEFSDLVTKILKEYLKDPEREQEFKDTYTRKTLLGCVKIFEDWLMFQHCIEDRETMTQRDQKDYEEWLDKNADRLAKEEQEYKDTF